ncbi:hypothetical protein D9M70_518210 [compost metagenome]
MNIQHRNHDRHFPLEFMVTSDQTFAVLDDRDVEAGTANVGMQDLIEAAQFR